MQKVLFIILGFLWAIVPNHALADKDLDTPCGPLPWANLQAQRNPVELEPLLRQRFSTFNRIGAPDNVRFRNIARLGPTEPTRPRFYFSGELAILKELNDRVFSQAKGMNTAFVNYYKELFFQELQRSSVLSAQQRARYSDFKMLRFAFQEETPEVQAELIRIYGEATRRFATYLESYGLKNYLSQFRGIASDPASWNLAGMGTTPAQADITARFARRRFRPGGTPLVHFRDIRADVVEALTEAQRLDRRIVQELGPRFPQLFTRHSDGAMELSPAAVEILLKTRPEERTRLAFHAAVFTRFMERFGFEVRLRPEDIELLINWRNSVDLFQPALYIDERTPVVVSNSRQGVLFFDVSGQNVRNFMATASALRRTRPGNVDEALEFARFGDISSTNELTRRRDFIRRAFEEFQIAPRGRHLESGDDGAFIADQSISRLSRVRFYRHIADSEFSGDFRWVWVEPTYGDTRAVMPAEIVERLGTLGENFEKDLRKSLEVEFMQIGFSRLRSIFMSVEITGRANAQPTAILYIAPRDASFRSQIQRQANAVSTALGIHRVEVRILAR